MEAYSQLLEKIRIPQPSLQKFAVISIFEKLRSASQHLDPDSGPGTDAITQCLHSTSAAVVDQSVRELCRLVRDSKMDLSRGLLELQSALEASDSRFVNVFVKGLGFLVRLGFQKNFNSFRFQASETHPFVKILSCREEVQDELAQQVLIFMVQSKHLGMVDACEFLAPFLNYSIVKMPVSASFSSFLRSLISSLAGLCCSFPQEAIPVIKLLIGRLRFFPCKNAEDSSNISHCVECIVDAYVVVLEQLVDMGLLVYEAQLCGVEILDAMFSLRTNPKHTHSIENILEVSRRILIVLKDLGLSYVHELSTITLSLFMVLVQSELEHEQFLVVKLLLFLLTWKNENEHDVQRDAYELNEELLLIFPVINLVSYPSKSVKQAATDLLHVLGKLSNKQRIVQKTNHPNRMKFPSIGTPEYIVFRLLQHLWLQDQSPLSGSFYLNLTPAHDTSSRGKHYVTTTWSSLLTDHLHGIIARRKFSAISQSQEIVPSDMPMILSAIACVLLLHQTYGKSSVNILANSSNVDAKLGVPLLLAIQFYNHIYSTNSSVDCHGILLKLLEMLPTLASHPAMIPLVIQTLLPMLQNEKKPVLYATAIRLMCKTWEFNDRVFGSLQGVLLANRFTQFASQRDICISMAVSICDICRRNPDRGVDLILSIAACIENQDPFIQSLGLQSLAHLCEADAIDFYSAWDVIAKHVVNYSSDAMVAHSLCLLLTWGAMDAQAYNEASVDVLKILWDIGTSEVFRQASSWSKARASAFVALACYEVEHLEISIPDFKIRNLEFLMSEIDPEVLRASEGFEVKILTYEHITRRRSVKQKRVSANKIEKLLDVFPHLIFASGKDRRARELPGAALFCLSFTHTDSRKPGATEGLQDVQAKYEASLVEIATSLQLSRNILIAILSLQSWKPFMWRWMRARILLLDTKLQTAIVDKTPKAAKELLKSMTEIAEKSLPRSAENIALAIGALCSVLPLSAHAVKVTASKFLLKWLFQHEHEYRQWSAAISLGVISSCLHITDHKQKFENINALLEVASLSKSTLVKGACGVGLGFSSQAILVSSADDNAQLDRETYKIEEADLLRKIIRLLSQLICQFTPSSADVLESLLAQFPVGSDSYTSEIAGEFLGSTSENLEEDAWGVAGLILGLSSCVGAMYRAGVYNAVLNFKALLISWIPHPDPSMQITTTSEQRELLLSVGSCLAVPIVMAICQRFDLIDDADLEHLVICYKELISELVSVKRFDTYHQSLLMASCLGAGSLIGVVLNEGLYSLKTQHISELLALFRKCYSDSNPPLIHLGAMLGVVNALGAGAGTLIEPQPLRSTHGVSDLKESSYITGPLITSAVFEPELASLVQEMFLVAQSSDAHQLQQHAAWAISFLRQYLWFKVPQNAESTADNDAVSLKTVSQSFPQDSTVMKLSSWLMHLNYLGTGAVTHVNTVSNILRCLSNAPRLPLLDWGAIIRRCMRYEGQVADSLDITFDKGNLREECLLFSLSHANQFDPLLGFLDELCDISRLRTLEPNLQFFVLSHLADLVKMFSGSRLMKLFEDVAEFLSWSFSSESCASEEKSSFKISCWRGLNLCLDESSLDTQDYKSSMENCMAMLFTLLPSAHTKGLCQGIILEEWSEAIRCLGKAQTEWLLDLLEVSEVNFTEGNSLSFEVVRKVQAKAKLVQSGSLPLTVLGKLKAYLLNSRSEDIWDALTEVSTTIQHAEGSVKRQWLIEAVEISCVTKFPSTALQFIGLLCGSCCKYRPVLTVDKFTVLSDLPVTLTSLLSDRTWMVVADSVASYFCTSTERIYECTKQLKGGDCLPSIDPIDTSENDVASFLLQVMHQACVSLKDHLPPEKQLLLANMVIPPTMDVYKLYARLNCNVKSMSDPSGVMIL